jgi:hypothetical protein
VYSSLLVVDVVARGDTTSYCQTDHRDRTTVAEQPEISVLFALTRLLGARAYATAQGDADPTIVYVCFDDPIPELVEAVAACGAHLELKTDERKRIPTPPVDSTPSALADRAFRALAERVRARVGLADNALALAALEAEILADVPVEAEDEPRYWTAILELAALGGEVLRSKHGGAWTESERSAVPFGFHAGDETYLLANRGRRFLEDGASESMFLVLGLSPADGAPTLLLPSLRARSEAEQECYHFRALIEEAGADADLPVIAYGIDRPQTFSLLTRDDVHDPNDLHATAMGHLALLDAEIEDLDLDGVLVSRVSAGYFGAEKLLDRTFMTSMHAKHGETLAAIVPCRGALLVSGIDGDDRVRVVAGLAAIAEHESNTSRRISTAVLVVSDGEVSGYARLGVEDSDETS